MDKKFSQFADLDPAAGAVLQAGVQAGANVKFTPPVVIAVTTGASPTVITPPALGIPIRYEITGGGTGDAEVLQINDLALDADNVNIPALGQQITLWFKTRSENFETISVKRNSGDAGWIVHDGLGNTVATTKRIVLAYEGASVNLVWGGVDAANTGLMSWNVDSSANNWANGISALAFDWQLLQVDFGIATLLAPPGQDYRETGGDSAVGSNVGGGNGYWGGGKGHGSGAGGYGQLFGGMAGATGRGGGAQVEAGDGGTTSGNGGNAELYGGNAGNGNGGGAFIQSGNGIGGNGGDVTIGVGTGTGTNGNLLITGLPTSDPHVLNAIYILAGVLKISAGP